MVIPSRQKRRHWNWKRGPTMKKDRRWLKSMLAASLEPQIGLPFQRGLRRRPDATKIDLRVAMKPRAMAAR